MQINDILSPEELASFGDTAKGVAVYEAAEIAVDWVNSRAITNKKMVEKRLREHLKSTITTQPIGFFPTLFWPFIINAVINYIIRKVIEKLFP